MWPILLGALLFATPADDAVQNPRFVSPKGEMCVVVRAFPSVGDFERVDSDEYYRRLEAAGDFAEPLPGQAPPQPAPPRHALYRIWPGGYQEPLAEFTCPSTESCEHVLVTDDGHIVTYGPLRGEKDAELLTIRASDGSVVRTLRVREVMTPNDQQWLSRGDADDVRFELAGDTLRMTMLVTDGRWDDPDGRHHTVDIDVESGSVAAPEADLCPAADRVLALADDGLPRLRNDADVAVLESQTLLDRAVVRVVPEYPTVATKARISGTVGVQVVVGTEGNVESVSIVKPLPFGLDEAVRTAIKQWQFARFRSRVSGVLAFRFELIRGPRLMVMTP